PPQESGGTARARAAIATTTPPSRSPPRRDAPATTGATGGPGSTRRRRATRGARRGARGEVVASLNRHDIESPQLQEPGRAPVGDRDLVAAARANDHERTVPRLGVRLRRPRDHGAADTQHVRIKGKPGVLDVGDAVAEAVDADDAAGGVIALV